MKALLVESNAARSRSEEIQKKEIPGQEKEIKKIEERIKTTRKVPIVYLTQWVT